jgi:hypothetical protein
MKNYFDTAGEGMFLCLVVLLAAIVFPLAFPFWLIGKVFGWIVNKPILD